MPSASVDRLKERMERERDPHGTPGISQDTLPLLTGMEASSPKVRAKGHSHLISQGWSVGVQPGFRSAKSHFCQGVQSPPPGISDHRAVLKMRKDYLHNVC